MSLGAVSFTGQCWTKMVSALEFLMLRISVLLISFVIARYSFGKLIVQCGLTALRVCG